MQIKTTIHLLFFIAITCYSTKILSQSISWQNTYIQPEISIGYTFKGNVTFGLKIDAGVVTNRVKEQYSGLSYNFRVMKFDRKLHKLHSLSAYYNNPIVDLQVGVGKMFCRHGFRRVNNCQVPGIIADLSFKYPDPRSPKIGINSFFYRKRDWGFFPIDYHTVYMGYEIPLRKSS